MNLWKMNPWDLQDLCDNKKKSPLNRGDLGGSCGSSGSSYDSPSNGFS